MNRHRWMSVGLNFQTWHVHSLTVNISLTESLIKRCQVMENLPHHCGGGMLSLNYSETTWRSGMIILFYGKQIILFSKLEIWFSTVKSCNTILLQVSYPCIVVPPLPEKRVSHGWQKLPTDRFDPDFIERRRVGLEVTFVQLHSIYCRVNRGIMGWSLVY